MQKFQILLMGLVMIGCANQQPSTLSADASKFGKEMKAAGKPKPTFTVLRHESAWVFQAKTTLKYEDVVDIEGEITWKILKRDGSEVYKAPDAIKPNQLILTSHFLTDPKDISVVTPLTDRVIVVYYAEGKPIFHFPLDKYVKKYPDQVN